MHQLQNFGGKVQIDSRRHCGRERSPEVSVKEAGHHAAISTKCLWLSLACKSVVRGALGKDIEDCFVSGSSVGVQSSK